MSNANSLIQKKKLKPKQSNQKRTGIRNELEGSIPSRHSERVASCTLVILTMPDTESAFRVKGDILDSSNLQTNTAGVKAHQNPDLTNQKP